MDGVFRLKGAAKSWDMALWRRTKWGPVDFCKSFLFIPRDPNSKTKKVGSWGVFRRLNAFSEGMRIHRVYRF